ncbi:MAG: hypothetical protein JO078_09205 [Candidatus Eremiobacteraeota bacterium]|nr:hypothetical protein [Candidatus Eremiobacteraeota bacterium]
MRRLRAFDSSGEVGLTVTGIQRMSVRIYKAWEDDAIAEIKSRTFASPPPFDRLRVTQGVDCGDSAFFYKDDGIIETAQSVKRDAVLRRFGIARNDRPGPNLQPLPFRHTAVHPPTAIP